MAPFYSRKPTRLSTYSYSSSGFYFLTLCTKEKQSILGTVCASERETELPQMTLSAIGLQIDAEIQRQNSCYSHISIEKYVIMPNHIHLLLYLKNESSLPAAANRPNEAIPKYISTLKRFTNRSVGFDLWQRSYHDHIIRNEQDYLRIWQYIDTNVAKWKNDCFYCT